MSLATSLISGLISGLAGMIMIFLGKAADIIDIARLIIFLRNLQLLPDKGVKEVHHFL